VNYERFCIILNKHIFKDEKRQLLRKIAHAPERFIGLFRPTKPGTKLLQYILQSHEIRMGDALEEIIQQILISLKFDILDKHVKNEKGERLSLDQYFTDRQAYYFIEQKVRDDHDSSKKRGQISNFQTKVEVLHKKHGSKLIGIMYFIDADLSKNKKYYEGELKKLEKSYGVELHIFYGKELFNYLKNPNIWDDILLWLRQWKDSLPELPEINLDTKPKESFDEIKDLEPKTWIKILQNDKIWDEGIIQAIFREGTTLQLLLDFFKSQNTTPYNQLASILSQRLAKYYRK